MKHNSVIPDLSVIPAKAGIHPFLSFSRTREFIFILSLALAFIFVVGACGDNAVPLILGPSDADIRTAETVASSLPVGTPERAAAEAKVAELKQARDNANDRAKTAATITDMVLPGAGTLLGVAWVVMQKIRNRKTKGALDATMIAIEDFKSTPGMGAAVDTLMTGLATRQDQLGVRPVIRDALAQLKQPDKQL